MNDQEQRPEDQDPAPLKHSDAERVSDDQTEAGGEESPSPSEDADTGGQSNQNS